MKYIILMLFLKFFEKELDDVEPEVDTFVAKLLKPHLKQPQKSKTLK